MVLGHVDLQGRLGRGSSGAAAMVGVRERREEEGGGKGRFTKGCRCINDRLPQVLPSSRR
jgi:hypothetical protein